MKWHPLCLKFPPLAGDDLTRFLAGIKASGGIKTSQVLYRVVKGQRQGLEGKQRYDACKQLKLPCRMQRVRVKDKDVADFIIRHNCNRRHLDSATRLALIEQLKAEGQSNVRIAEALGRLGVTVVDAPPEQLPPALADHYLMLKSRGLL